MGAAGDDLAEDEHIYLGTSETRGLMMISPALSSYVADELHKRRACSRRDAKYERRDRQLGVAAH
eukprot:1262300-Pyramimonas_sp.AAC.1